MIGQAGASDVAVLYLVLLLLMAALPPAVHLVMVVSRQVGVGALKLWLGSLFSPVIAMLPLSTERVIREPGPPSPLTVVYDYGLSVVATWVLCWVAGWRLGVNWPAMAFLLLALAHLPWIVFFFFRPPTAWTQGLHDFWERVVTQRHSQFSFPLASGAKTSQYRALYWERLRVYRLVAQLAAHGVMIGVLLAAGAGKLSQTPEAVTNAWWPAIEQAMEQAAAAWGQVRPPLTFVGQLLTTPGFWISIGLLALTRGAVYLALKVMAPRKYADILSSGLYAVPSLIVWIVLLTLFKRAFLSGGLGIADIPVESIQAASTMMGSPPGVEASPFNAGAACGIEIWMYLMLATAFHVVPFRNRNALLLTRWLPPIIWVTAVIMRYSWQAVFPILIVWAMLARIFESDPRRAEAHAFGMGFPKLRYPHFWVSVGTGILAWCVVMGGGVDYLLTILKGRA